MGSNLGYHVLKLSLGFESYPYTTKSPRTRKILGKGVRIQKGYGVGKRTTDVAKELEDRYNLTEIFWDKIENMVVGEIEVIYSDMLEEVMAGVAYPKKAETSELTEQIEDAFKTYLDRETHGIKTLAAQRGVSYLLPHPYARGNPPRPSFIDTGLYRQSFRAWVEDAEEV